MVWKSSQMFCRMGSKEHNARVVQWDVRCCDIWRLSGWRRATSCFGLGCLACLRPFSDWTHDYVLNVSCEDQHQSLEAMFLSWHQGCYKECLDQHWTYNFTCDDNHHWCFDRRSWDYTTRFLLEPSWCNTCSADLCGILRCMLVCQFELHHLLCSEPFLLGLAIKKWRDRLPKSEPAGFGWNSDLHGGILCIVRRCSWHLDLWHLWFFMPQRNISPLCCHCQR